MAAGFELRPHTADIRLVLWAESLPELFAIALQGLAEVLLPQRCQQIGRLPLRRTLVIHEADSTALLIEFLGRVLLYSQIRKALFCRARFRGVTETDLDAVIYGAPVGGFQQDVKAVTYHEAEVRRLHTGQYTAHLVLDV
ncbi:MAG: archease [Chlorobiota bacterium]